MAKLTKAQKKEIESALAAVRRATAFIHSDRIALCSVSEVNAKVPQLGSVFRSGEIVRSQSYEHRDPTQPGWTIDYIHELSPISKGVGSDLVALHDAQRALTRLLEA